MKSHLLSIVVLLGVCCAPVADAQTQTPEPGPTPPPSVPTGTRRPYRALFGGAASDPSKHQIFDFTFSVAEGYDDNVLAGVGVSTPGGAAEADLHGLFTVLQPAVSYAWNGQSVQFSAVAGSDLRYYQRAHEFLGSSHYGAVGLSAGSRRTHVALNQSVTYSPSYFYGLFPPLGGDVAYPVGGSGDYAVNADQIVVYDTSARFAQGLTSRSSLEFLGSFRYSDLSSLNAGRKLQSYSAGGRYLYDLSRNATVHLGYIYREGQYAYTFTDRPLVAHDIDIGVDYHRPLSFSRRTRVEFGMGSSIVKTPYETNASTERLQYRVVGNAGLTHDMGRTWRARVEYYRGVSFIEAVRQPVFTNSVNTSLEGFLSRRTDLHIGGALSIGDAGLSALPQNNVRTYTANVRLRRAITANWALFGEYLYYNYDLGRAVVITDGVPSSMTRNAARVGLSVWLPLVRK